MNIRAEFLPVVTELLMEFGATATLTRTTKVGGSAYKAGAGTSSTQTFSTLAVVAPETITDEQGRQVTVTMATMLAQPATNDTLALGPSTYIVGAVTRIAPQGQPIVWKAVVTQ